MSSYPAEMPEAYRPLREGDHVRLDGRDAIVMEPAPSGPGERGLAVVQVAVVPGDLIWVGRYRNGLEAKP